jgi:hypothetical protein
LLQVRHAGLDPASRYLPGSQVSAAASVFASGYAGQVGRDDELGMANFPLSENQVRDNSSTTSSLGCNFPLAGGGGALPKAGGWTLLGGLFACVAADPAPHNTNPV